MAFMRTPKDEDVIKKITITNLRKEYLDLADYYLKVLNQETLLCPDCGDWLGRKTNFYVSKKYGSGYFPMCKKCVGKRVNNQKRDGDIPKPTKESVCSMLREMDLPYIDSFYESCLSAAEENIGSAPTFSPFQRYLGAIQSFPQFSHKTWKDSEFPASMVDGVEVGTTDKKVKQKTIDRFGEGLTTSDYIFLQKEYEDWITRYECQTKVQEEIFVRLSSKKLEIIKAQREGKSTKDLDRSYQDYMATAGITPRQSNTDSFVEGKTMGTLLAMYEESKPLPEIDPELEDVDRIGQYIEVFFKGHLQKAFGLKNKFAYVYEAFMKKYTATRPSFEESDDDDTESWFSKLFGKVDDE